MRTRTTTRFMAIARTRTAALSRTIARWLTTTITLSTITILLMVTMGFMGFTMGCARQEPPAQQTAAGEMSTLEYAITEMTDAACTQDDECETPVGYLIRSNCPYSSKCIKGQCAVICPNLARFNAATASAWQHVESREEYQRFNGTDIRITSIAAQDTGYLVDVQFTLQSEKNLSRREHGKAQLTIVDGAVVDAAYSQGGPEVLTAEECAARGGSIVAACAGTEIGVVDNTGRFADICCAQ